MLDNGTPEMDFRGDPRFAPCGMDLGWQVLHAPGTVEWLAGDESAAARACSEGKTEGR